MWQREIVRTALVLSLIWLLSAGAIAEPGHEAYLIRVLVCKGSDANMELYLPQSIVLGNTSLARTLAQPTIGYYALDLSDANKGKTLEPVKVSMTAGGKMVIIDQYTRGLPPTWISVNGGTVDFDQRFGTQSKCGPFQTQQR
jgi:hypothetical protein